ncbi:DUF2835 domain-containing protein [Marinagarivorans algicola]|uniref:DUF2835 domain-containing protein n=1 Tax=Marinagarivorans algicola TaxID=1513270 RepID=UPI0030838C05
MRILKNLSYLINGQTLHWAFYITVIDMPQAIEIHLNISARKYLLLYQGVARNVLATAVDGRRVRFPAKILQPFVTHSGVNGRFTIYFSDDGRFSHIQQLAPPM